MTIPSAALDFLTERAKTVGVASPARDDDLFKSGVLDSFQLVDLVVLIEANGGIKIPDSDIDAENFQSIAAIEQYLSSRKD